MADNMSDGYIYVDYANVDNAVDEMRLQTREIEKIISSLNDELQPLQKSWEGDDREAYSEKQAAWNQAVANMRKWLGDNAQTLNHIRDLYTHNERSQTQSWQGVKIGR